MSIWRIVACMNVMQWVKNFHIYMINTHEKKMRIVHLTHFLQQSINLGMINITSLLIHHVDFKNSHAWTWIIITPTNWRSKNISSSIKLRPTHTTQSSSDESTSRAQANHQRFPHKIRDAKKQPPSVISEYTYTHATPACNSIRYRDPTAAARAARGRGPSYDSV